MAAHKAEKFGLEDRRVVISLSQVAEVYAGQGKYVEAEPVYLRALKVYRTVHGEFQANVATTLKKLGILHCMYGLYAQAEPLLTRALAIKEKLLGRDHSDVALSVVNLAQLRQVKSSRRKRNRCTVDPWRFQSGRWGCPIQRSRRCWRTLPMPCGNEGVQTRRSRGNCVPKTFAPSGVEPVALSSVAYPLWRYTTSRLSSTGA